MSDDANADRFELVEWRYDSKNAAIYDQHGSLILTIFIDVETTEAEEAEIEANAEFAAKAPALQSEVATLRARVAELEAALGETCDKLLFRLEIDHGLKTAAENPTIRRACAALAGRQEGPVTP